MRSVDDVRDVYVMILTSLELLMRNLEQKESVKYPRSKSMNTLTCKTNQEEEVWFVGENFSLLRAIKIQIFIINSLKHKPINDFGFYT